jgi:predicted Zn-dependent protease
LRPQEIVERALELSRSDGTLVLAQESSSTNLRWAGSTLTTNGEVRGRSLTVIATVDGAQGTASGVVSRSNVTADQVEALVRAAEQAARGAEPAEDARPLVGPGETSTGAGGWEDEPAVTTSAVFSALAPELGEVFVRSRAEGRELFGFAEHDLTSTYLGSSAGLRLRHDQPTGRLEMTGKTDARTLSSFVGQGSRTFQDVDVAALDAELTRRLGWARRSVDVAPGRHDTILPPSAVADLMVYLYWSASAREAHDGRTVFSKPGGGTRVGDRLAQLPVQLWSDPAAAGLECEPFVLAGQSGPSSSVFDNGLPLARTSWVQDGALAALLQTRASADLTGLPVTPAVDNLLMEVSGPQGTVAGTDALVASTTDRALLLTCLWYIREVDPQTLLLTGLTRDGVYVVEGGEVVGAATNFRFNMSPVDVLDRIRAATTTQPCLAREWGDYFTRTSMPALLVDGFNMSTVSQAS